ncbi:unnamed protein product, partial [Musa hybrid cultivar]
MCSRTVYCTNIDKKVSQADLKLFFESICGEAESATAALNCSGVVLGSMPLRYNTSLDTPRAPGFTSVSHANSSLSFEYIGFWNIGALIFIHDPAPRPSECFYETKYSACRDLSKFQIVSYQKGERCFCYLVDFHYTKVLATASRTLTSSYLNYATFLESHV